MMTNLEAACDCLHPVVDLENHTETALCILINVCGLTQKPVQRAEDAHGGEAERGGGEEIPEFTAGPAQHAGPTEEQERGRELYPLFIQSTSHSVIWKCWHIKGK